MVTRRTMLAGGMGGALLPALARAHAEESARIVPVQRCSRLGVVPVKLEQKFWSQMVNASASS